MNWIKKRQTESAQPATDNAESVQPQRLTSDVNTFLASFDSLLYKIANKYKGALVDHDDLMQEARTAITKAYDKYDGNNKATPKTFFSNVAKNAMLNAINKENRRQKKQISTENKIGENLKLEDVLPDETVPTSEQGEFDKVSYRENPQEFKARAKTFLASLNPQDRRIMQYHLDGMTPSKIAEKQGVTEKDPRKIKARIKKLNQKMIDDMGIMPHETKTKQINQKFNDDIDSQIKGELPDGYIYQLGTPSDILLSTAIPDLPIELSASHLTKKANQKNHPFNIEDIKNLPEALQTPVAVFEYGDKSKAQNIIVEIEKDGKNFLVGLSLNSDYRGIAINDIRGLFPKETANWLNWIQEGKALYLNKEKVQKLITQQRTNLAEVSNLDLNSISNIINNFENASDIAEKNQEKFHITRKRKQINPIVQAGKVRDNYQDLLENKEYTPETIEQWDKKAVEYILIRRLGGMDLLIFLFFGDLQGEKVENCQLFGDFPLFFADLFCNISKWKKFA